MFAHDTNWWKFARAAHATSALVSSYVVSPPWSPSTPQRSLVILRKSSRTTHRQKWRKHRTNPKHSWHHMQSVDEPASKVDARYSVTMGSSAQIADHCIADAPACCQGARRVATDDLQLNQSNIEYIFMKTAEVTPQIGAGLMFYLSGDHVCAGPPSVASPRACI